MGRPAPAIRLVTVEKEAVSGCAAGSVSDPKHATAVLRELIGAKDREHFVVLHLSARNCISSAEIVSVGTLTGSLVHPREVFKGAILANAAALICGHNHPSGSASPSPEDTELRRRLTAAGELLGIPLLDFIVVTTGSDSWSAKAEGQL